MPQKLSLELCEKKKQRGEVGLSLLSVLALGGFGLVGSWVSMPTSQVCVCERERETPFCSGLFAFVSGGGK